MSDRCSPPDVNTEVRLMRTRIDPEKCNGNRCCAEECPEVYEIVEGFGEVRAGMEDVPDGLLPKVQAAVMACPEGAVMVEA
jgi:ferredoxin